MSRANTGRGLVLFACHAPAFGAIPVRVADSAYDAGRCIVRKRPHKKEYYAPGKYITVDGAS
eukprot:1959030-Rhodomonas_salina.8